MSIQSSSGMPMPYRLVAILPTGVTEPAYVFNSGKIATPSSILILRIVAEVIADDRHVPNALFKMIYKLKGAKGICLVSDSLSVAGISITSADERLRSFAQDTVPLSERPISLNTYCRTFLYYQRLCLCLRNLPSLSWEQMTLYFGTKSFE